MTSREVEEASFGLHRSWLAACGRDHEALDAAAESITGLPNGEKALDCARDLVEQFESQAAHWRGVVRALEQVPANRQVLGAEPQ